MAHGPFGPPFVLIPGSGLGRELGFSDRGCGDDGGCKPPGHRLSWDHGCLERRFGVIGQMGRICCWLFGVLVRGASYWQ